MFEKFDLGLITKNAKILERCKSICRDFNYSLKEFELDETITSNPVDYRVVLIAGLNFPNGGEFSAFLGTIRNQFPDTFLMYVETEAAVENSVEIAKKSGCNLALKESEFFDTSKPEYICSQVIRTTYLPIKSTDIVVNKPIQFDLYHLLPQRQKFIKFCFEGDEIDKKRLDKILAATEVYIHRNQADQFATYVTSHVDNTPEGMSRKCRSRFIALYATYTNLVLSMTDQSDSGSFGTGEELFKKCRDLAGSLLGALAAHPNPWDIISKATVGDFGSVERAPAVAAYTGIVGLVLNLNSIEEMMIAPLLSEIGLLFLPNRITEAVRKNSIDKLTNEDLKAYTQYPLKSLAAVLNRKVQLTEPLRNIISCVHEKSDKTGFPGKKFGKFIPQEACIIHFALELDQRTAVKLGSPAVDVETAINELLETESRNPSHFTLQFTLKLKMTLKSKLTPNR